MSGAEIEPATAHQRGALPTELSTGAGGQLACLSSPPVGARRTCGPLWARLSVTHWIVGFVVNDVVYAARLPFDPGSPACGAVSYAEGCWSPALTECHANRQAKASRTYTCESGDTSWRAFLSQAGPQVGLELFKLSITFWLEVVGLPFRNEKGDPLGRPYLPWCLR
jgi:hypothetical protein